ncbi:phosphate ABC transporter membrane protein 2, PhoT family (TC 3.A.1.7.1) [Hathewaya proteolytica DSM 3090]|uniref:Phosphate transport system permease protein PstA n=1 Tax=Hathewaya proteolytica DSM 3090 TaxID=1121331 RepID=A0A1M6PVR2_9CLOT|nr:phosphate ABC transporter permease PstA [Hathewaya proteolytica]SHK11980.1 phosphate ABC transporter membrane protein 2, PhoT family (TC 3.A.1.7.1) [Hathewaya proteolytica DSM 3090]
MDNGTVSVRLKKKLKSIKRNPLSFILYIFVILAAVITFTVLLFIVGYILINGVPNITGDLFSLKYTSENGSVMPALMNTIIITVLSLILAVPLGIFSSIYIVEYAKKGNKLMEISRLTVETLAGIPSIVYGLFGFLLFVTALRWRYSILAGTFTLAIMILPLIMRTTEEALKSVPDSYREGSFGLGAGKLRTVFKIVLPSAVPGILAGVILSIGRIVGETAALMYTAGTIAEIPKSVMDSGRTLAVHMYAMSSEGLHMDKAYATAVVLLVIVLMVNLISAYVAKRIGKGKIDG